MQRISTEQLFHTGPLLEKRLGKEAFESIPTSPGIYRFYDVNGDLLYVGKAKNLRRRLFGYKRAKPGKVSRKVSTLIGKIRSVIWVETATEHDALLLENRMIRGARPPFNHAKKETETYYYIYFKPDSKYLAFRLSMKVPGETNKQYWYGCFKGHRSVRQAMGALLRLLWLAEYNVKNPAYLPVQLNRNLTPMHYCMRWNCPGSPALSQAVPGMLEKWLRAESPELLDWFWVNIETEQRLNTFQNCYLETHLDVLKTFYDKKLVQHRDIRGDKSIIAQDEIDDLLVGKQRG